MSGYLGTMLSALAGKGLGRGWAQVPSDLHRFIQVGSPERGPPPFLGRQVLHVPSRAPAPANHSHHHRRHPGLGSPHSPSKTELDLFPMILDWRARGGKGLEAAMAEAEDAAGSTAVTLLGGKEPHAEQFAEPASPGPSGGPLGSFCFFA